MILLGSAAARRIGALYPLALLCSCVSKSCFPYESAQQQVPTIFPKFSASDMPESSPIIRLAPIPVSNSAAVSVLKLAKVYS